MRLSNKKGGSRWGPPFLFARFLSLKLAGCSIESCLFLADVFVPDFRVNGDVTFEQLAAILAVQIDDVYVIFAQPSEASGEGTALACDHRADAKLAYQSAAIPAGAPALSP